MALIHDAQLSPSKLEMLSTWVPTQPWGGTGLDTVGAYRFDDPDGQVGMETHVLRAADEHILQVPLTYRGTELAGADAHLLGTMEHSVLGRRWVYDATGDPVYVRALAAALIDGVPQARLEYHVEGRSEFREPTVQVSTVGATTQDTAPVVTVTSSSTPTVTVVESGGLRITVRRVLGAADEAARPGPRLVGTWQDLAEPVELVLLG